jgi:membrane associated rhomboid family serine protease
LRGWQAIAIFDRFPSGKGLRVNTRQPVFNLPGVILALLAACIAVQLAREFVSPQTDAWIVTTFGFIPARFSRHFAPGGLAEAVVRQITAGMPESTVRWFLGQGGWPWWSPVSYIFLHGDWMHLGLNGLWLAAFGSAVARRFGPLRFLALFLLSGIAGAAAFILVHPYGLTPVVGASAAISGAVAAAMRFAFEPGAPLGPGRSLAIGSDSAYYVPALPLARVLRDGRALTFLLTWFGCNILFGAFATPLGVGDVTVAWEAHIGGFLAGLFAFSLFDRRPDQTPAVDPLPEPEFGSSTASQESGARHLP